MEVVIGIAVNFVTAVAKCTIAPVKNPIKYLSDYEKNVQSLKDQVDRLKDARETVKCSVDAAKGNAEEILGGVEKWMTTVDKKIHEEVEKVMQDEEKAKIKCFFGLCPSFWTRYKFSMKAEEEAKSVAELLEQGKFDGVSHRPSLQSLFSTEGFQEFESRRVVLNGIIEALKDTSIKVIGVYGMGGVGKTTLVKEVAKQVNGQLFDSVLIATVTQTVDVRGIQDQIADFLGLKFEEQSMDGRAARLRQGLKIEKKILVVLDDIWKDLDLEEVGIPFGNENEGCKILLTSRDLNVLSRGMDTQKNFEVVLLKEEEAWGLFKKMAGDSVESCDLQPIAMAVAKKCARLPIAISTVARALKSQNSKFEWDNALRELERPSPGNFTGIMADAYKAIEFSYKYLQSEEDKLTFLLCGLIGHNGHIEDVLKYSYGLGCFHGVYTIKEARDKVLSVVSKLKASCLLLDGYNNERFDIHDVVWDVALSIALNERHMVVLRNDDVLKEWPNKERMSNCSAIYLHSPRIITELPDEMECSHLTFFRMGHLDSVKIPANFFRGTKRLKVLDFSGMHFPSLPVSINLLINLQTLRLDDCALEEISIIGKLKSLEILSLVRSDIQALPIEIAELTQLRLLDLSYCTKLKIIPPNVLSYLSSLEELYMENSFVQWEEKVRGAERRNASLVELKHLTDHLTTLYVHIPHAQIIPKCLFSETLERYRIFIGDYYAWDWSDKFKYSRVLRVKLDASIYLDHGVKILLKKTEDLYLAQLRGVKNVLDELNNGEDLPHLKKLCIQDGLDVQYITTEKMEFSQLKFMKLHDLPQLNSFSSDRREQGDTSPKPLFNKQIVFHQLESLELSSIKIPRIWHSHLSETHYSFPNLKSLIIKGCGNLEHLFSSSVVRSLVQLQLFEIEECNCLREIIFTEEIEEGNKDVICFSVLNSLKISGLQNLIKFSSGNYDMEFPSLKKLSIKNCPKLEEFINETKMEGNCQSGVRAFFNEKVAFPSLQKLRISNLRNVKMIFHKELEVGSFCKLEDMAVQDCHQLSTIFPSTTVRVFSCLEKLNVNNCDSLEQIFGVGGLIIEEKLGVEYSQLRELEIHQLPALKHVWSNDPAGFLTFRNLRNVHAEGCRSLKYLFSVSIAKDLPTLESLELRRCGVEEIVRAREILEEPIRFEFPQLSSLVLTKLDKLKCFYPGQYTIVWPMLKKLGIDCSTLMNTTVASERLNTQQLNGNSQQDSIIGQQLFSIEEFPEDLFHQIKVFEMNDPLFGESACFPINFFQRFYNLETLQFFGRNFEGTISFVEDVDEKLDAGRAPSRIRVLKLNHCKNLARIWKKGSELCHIIPYLETLEVNLCTDLINFGSSLSSFQNLTNLEVGGCHKMINLVTPSAAQSLVHLKGMRIWDCSMMKEIVANSKRDEATYDITFSKLKYLELSYFEKLESFCAENHNFKFPSLEELIVNGCRRLKVFCKGVISTPKLQRVKGWDFVSRDGGCWFGDLNTTIQVGYGNFNRCLILSDTFSDVMEIWNTNPLEILGFERLGELEVCNCRSLKYIFTPSMALGLKSLGTLKVKGCSDMEEVMLGDQGVEDGAMTEKFTFPRLHFIKIDSCSNIACFYLGSGALHFRWLGSIRITDCPKMTTFASSYSRDKEKETIGDQGDLNIIASSFFSDNKVVCPDLTFLTLFSINIEKIWDLQQPTSSLCAQNLRYLEIKGCQNLKYLFPSFMIKHFPRLLELSISGCKMMEEVIFFMEGLIEEERMNEIMFLQLEFLCLNDLPKLTRFCNETCNEFPRLKNLDLKNCPLLKTFISKSETKHVEVVGDESEIDQITKRNNLEVENSALFNEEVLFPSLKWLTIKGLRDCRKIWQDQLNVNLFCELNGILVEGCEKLLNIFPFNMMERLEELDKLQILDCDSLEEIFDPRGVIATQSIMVEREAKFVFPKVTNLQLVKLPKLKGFCSKIHPTEWPSLKKLKLIECHEAEMFASECPCFGEIQTESPVEISNQKPLFWVNEAVFPVLEELVLDLNHALKGTWHGQLLADCFRKLKALKLIHLPEKSVALPYYFIRSLPDIEKLGLEDGSICHIFQSEGLNQEKRHSSVLTRLRELWLYKLLELTHLWNEEFRTVFGNIRILEVDECGKLQTLVPSLASFENLTILEVSRCHGLLNLIACSAVKGLRRLERISITDCKMIKEIVACEGEEINGGIVFTELMYLQLGCLPSLASFSSGDDIFEFPVLEKVIVRECSKMKIFCEGDLSTPNLHGVQIIEDEKRRQWDEDEGEDEKIWLWEGNLNTTIQEIFKETKVQSSGVVEINPQ